MWQECAYAPAHEKTRDAIHDVPRSTGINPHETVMTMSRRQVRARTGAVVTGVAAGWLEVPARLRAAPRFTLPPLPYAENALLDYKSSRADYITAFLEHLVHWDFVAENLVNA